VRYQALDGWRGIAALAVAVFHLNVLHHAYSWPLVRHAYLFVDFFFVLSGFIIAHAYANQLGDRWAAITFAVRRFGRVWPLHAAVLLAYIALECLRWGYAAAIGQSAKVRLFDAGGPVPLADLPAQITLTNGLGILSSLSWNLPSWSISAEFWTYLVFATVTVMLPGNRLRLLAGFAAASALALVMYSPDGIDATCNLGFFRCVYGFSLGVLVREVCVTWRPPATQVLAAAELAACAATLLFVTFAGKGALSFIAPLVFAVSVYVFSFEAGALSRLLKTAGVQALGRWSYSIYMVHALVIAIVDLAAMVLQRPVFGHDIRMTLANGSHVIGVLPPLALDFLMLAYLAVVIALARLTFMYIEEPHRRWFHGKSAVIAAMAKPQAALKSLKTSGCSQFN
jgi:peptidoglycan/LPS O-acetylase OafA/YrhL